MKRKESLRRTSPLGSSCCVSTLCGRSALNDAKSGIALVEYGVNAFQNGVSIDIERHLACKQS